ncbi:MAG TPA: FAD-dependent oxidoreductase, partial [Polyangiaceae bacterium]|nr:FAD-dependent oxidoreductase [Polyangiaceae bacterium]
TTEAHASHHFDGAVIATTARSAARLLGDSIGQPARALRDSALLSSLTVSLAFRAERVRHSLAGTGFIVPSPEELEGVRAVTFASSKLPHRAPMGSVLLRLFFRPSEHDLQALSDAAWTERAERALGLALPVSGSAERAWVSRWPDALPVCDDAHRARVAALEAALSAYPLRLAGAAFHGSGIDAAIRSGEHAAQALARG